MSDVSAREDAWHAPLRWISLCTWAVVGPSIALGVYRADPLHPFRFSSLLWLLLCLMGGWGLWALSGAARRTWTFRTWKVVLLLTSISLLAMVGAWQPSYLGSLLLVFTAWHAADRLSFRSALLWAGIQCLVLGAIFWPHCPQGPFHTWSPAGLIYAGIQGFAVLAAGAVRSESESRRILARSNAELRATQEILASGSRLAERMRVARELHDVLGHRLAALSLNLEAAAHQPREEARASVARAQGLTAGLLSEVRSVVGTLRGEGEVDLQAALEALAEGIHRPHIQLVIQGDLHLDDPARAHALVRCVQEIITNTLKHAEAQNLWVEVECHPEGLVLRARDDGKGASQVREGHGLSGMRERLLALGGRLDLTPSGLGFGLNIWLPASALGVG